MGRRTIIEAVEEEFGQPFWEVVQGFADDGHSVYATSQLLGYASNSSFNRLLERHGKTFNFANNKESVFSREEYERRRGICTPNMANAVNRMKESNPTYIWIERDGVKDTLAGHARRNGLPVRTVYNRYRRKKDVEYALHKGSHVKPPPRGMGWQAMSW